MSLTPYTLDFDVWRAFERVTPHAAPALPGPQRKKTRLFRSAFVVVLLCAGGMVGTDALEPLGGKLVLAVDLREKYLNALGASKALVWKSYKTPEKKQNFTAHALRAFSDHDDGLGPFKIAASVQRGYYITEKLYEQGIGTLDGDRRSESNDLNLLLQAVRDKYSGAKIVLMASPPCRMFSNANQRSHKDTKEDFLTVTNQLLRKMRWSQQLGYCDAVIVECSAKGRRVKGAFVPGKVCQSMVDALNCVGEPMYKADKIDAADYGAYTTRHRLFIAPAGAHSMLPDTVGHVTSEPAPHTCFSDLFPPKKYRGWGWACQVGKTSKLRLVGGTWMPHEFAGAKPSEPGPTVTTHRLFVYKEGMDEVTMVPMQRRGELMGLRADDPRLSELAAMSSKDRNTLTGITFCVQYYLATNTAVAAYLGVFRDQQHASQSFWRYENQRHATHPAPQRGLAARRHNLEVARLEGTVDVNVYMQRHARLYKKKLKTA